MSRRLLALALLSAACAAPPPGNVDLERLQRTETEPGQWLTLGRNWQGHRHSPLRHLTADNATQLGFAWEYEARSRRGRARRPPIHRLPGGGACPLASPGGGPRPVTAIWWIRRDLRLADNPALTAALAAHGPVIPAFVLDPILINSPYNGLRRTAFLLDGLRALDADLRARGGRLIVRGGDPERVLADLRAETGAASIYAQRDVSPYAVPRDRRVQRALPLVLTDGLTVHPPGEVVRQDGGAYTVFTPFSRAWLARPLPGPRDLLPAPARILTPSLASIPIPDAPDGHPAFPAGEQEALRRLEALIIQTNPSVPVGVAVR